jgi:hypothetical protein
MQNTPPVVDVCQISFWHHVMPTSNKVFSQPKIFPFSVLAGSARLVSTGF